jgi:hypothetical protein
MSTVEERMRWRPGDPSPPLALSDVLVMLKVERRPENEQRRAIDDALREGSLGASSVAALRSAGWIDTKRIDKSPSPSVAGRWKWAAPAVLSFAVCVTAIWVEDSSNLLRVVATALLVLTLAITRDPRTARRR